MKAHATWQLEPGVRAVDVECGGEGWIISALGLETATCPDCHERSTRRHGWQLRRLQDLPVQGRPVTLQVRVTRWRCQNRRCERQTFADRLPQAARPGGPAGSPNLPDCSVMPPAAFRRSVC